MVDQNNHSSVATIRKICSALARFQLDQDSEVVIQLPDGDIVPVENMSLILHRGTGAQMVMLIASNPEDKH